MKILFRHLCGGLRRVRAGQDESEKAIGRGVELVAPITGQIGEVPVFGAGIVFARDKDHCDRQPRGPAGSEQAVTLRVRRRCRPEQRKNTAHPGGCRQYRDGEGVDRTRRPA